MILIINAAVIRADADIARGGLRVRTRRKERSVESALASAFQVSELQFEPQPDKLIEQPHLIQFKGKGDSYCAMMEPMKTQLVKELGVDIRCFEVWYDSRNLELLQLMDGGKCGGVPFFYNKRSKRFICGATTYDNLKLWAMGEICEPFLPPENLKEQQKEAGQIEEQSELRKNLGGVFNKIKAKAKEKLDERLGAGSSDK